MANDTYINYLCHARKWKKHKYIRIENGRYIYPEDLEKENASAKSKPNLPKSGADSVHKEVAVNETEPKKPHVDELSKNVGNPNNLTIAGKKREHQEALKAVAEKAEQRLAEQKARGEKIEAREKAGFNVDEYDREGGSRPFSTPENKDLRTKSYTVEGVEYTLQSDGTYRSKDGAKLTVKQGTNLFTKAHMLSSYTGAGKNKQTENIGGTLYVGKFDQYVNKYKDKGEEFINNLFKKKKKK